MAPWIGTFKGVWIQTQPDETVLKGHGNCAKRWNEMETVMMTDFIIGPNMWGRGKHC
ncbi:MAG: hypothetical protein HOK45_17125 [Verrucomicrobia bacterium]|jgi:hypothetical protein|nr:hypothetical protein [Verrucomicrobiota bacterium]MDA7631867.1 hypothetical protein [Verrucomicrobiota bacterium]